MSIDWRSTESLLQQAIHGAGPLTSFGTAILADLTRAGASYDAASAVQRQTIEQVSQVPNLENIALVSRVTGRILAEYEFRDVLERSFVEERAQILGLALNDPQLPVSVCGTNEDDPFLCIFGEGDPSAPPILITHNRNPLQDDLDASSKAGILGGRLDYLLGRPEIQADAHELEEVKVLAALPLFSVSTQSTTVLVQTTNPPDAVVDALNAQIARANHFITELGT